MYNLLSIFFLRVVAGVLCSTQKLRWVLCQSIKAEWLQSFTWKWQWTIFSPRQQR